MSKLRVNDILPANGLNIGVGTAGGNFIVGGASTTVVVNGGVNATGSVTASTFIGDGSGITGVTASGSGINIKDDGSIVGVAATIDFSTNLNVSPASAGIVTVTVGDTDFAIVDKIVHTGDTDTAIRFPAADTITAETGGSERLHINSAGNVGIGTDNPTEKLHVLGDARITGILTVGTASITIDGDAGTITATTFTGTATNLSNAANITTGTLADARIPNLAASKITSGTFDSGRIPNLAASKITSGTFDSGRIPNLAASKITSGTLNVDITTSRVTDEVATSTAGTKGSYAFLGQTTNTARSPNATLAGSSLRYANANGPESGAPGGSWRLMGRLGTGEDQEKASLWVRYA